MQKVVNTTEKKTGSKEQTQIAYTLNALANGLADRMVMQRPLAVQIHVLKISANHRHVSSLEINLFFSTGDRKEFPRNE